METQPKISVILPTMGNRPDGLKRSLDSIKTLDYPQDLIETIVITDNPRLGLPTRLKEGVEQSTGDWIVFASDDTEFTPDTIRNVLEEMAEKGKRFASFNSGPILPDEGNICEHFIIRRDLVNRLPKGEIFDLRLNHLGTDNLLWARLKKMGEEYHSEKGILHHYHFSKPGGNKMDSTYMEAWRHDRVIKDREMLQKIKEEEGLNQ